MITSALYIRGRSGNSTIRVAKGIRNLEAYAPFDRGVIITDTHVRRLYEKDFPPFKVVEIGAGEGIKTLSTVTEIYDSFLHLGLDRSSFVVGIGGGVVCDITGFAASTYLRGLRFGLIPTTLLSQVDAGIGGKNGVNLNGYKNMVGLFSQPEFVLCDVGLLNTLPARELLIGFSEIVKHALIADKDLFSYLEENHEKALELQESVMEKLVRASLKIKTGVVNRDETETGERRVLNFGHTFGHAIERTTGASHGEAVSVGMVMASLFSQMKGYLPLDRVERIKTLLTKLGLPTRADLNREAVFDGVRKDKKRSGEKIHFVFLTDIGHAVVEEVALSELEQMTGDMNWSWH